MTSLDFITKAQFEAVYSHFKELDENEEASKEDLLIEYKLLLGYFRSLYGDSARKNNKIMHLTAELTKFKERSEEVEEQRENEMAEVQQKLSEMNQSISKYQKGEIVLIRLIEKLREDIFVFKERDDINAKKWKSDIFICRRPTDPPRKSTKFREIAVGSSTILKSSRSTRREFIHSPTKPKQHHSVGEEQKRQKEKDPMSPELEFMKKKYEDGIEKLQKQVKTIATEAKLLRSEVAGYKKRIDGKDEYFAKQKQRLSEEIELEKEQKETLQLNNSSLRILIDKLVYDINTVKDEKQLLEEEIKNCLEERRTFLQQIEAKDKEIANLENKIVSLTKSKQSAIKKACVFEENLTMNREQLTTAKMDADTLLKTVNKLQTDLKECESELNHQKSLRNRIEASQKTALLEQTKLIDFYKAQLSSRDKMIKSLTTDLEKTKEILSSCRRQLRRKTRQNAMLSEEFQQWKKNLGINTENMKSLKMKLESARTSKSELQSELKLTKSQYFSAIKERSKLFALCKHQDTVIERREMENKLLNHRQEYLESNVKMKEAQLEKIAKLRRQIWAKY